jgi:hypothetical protein
VGDRMREHLRRALDLTPEQQQRSRRSSMRPRRNSKRSESRPRNACGARWRNRSDKSRRS